MLENFGLRVIAERPYELALARRRRRVDPGLRARASRRLARRHRAHRSRRSSEAFAAAWRGDIENDGFNRLLLSAGLTAREIVVLRAYCRYLLQTGVPFSQAYMERTLADQRRHRAEPGAAVRDAFRSRCSKQSHASAR